MTLRSLLVGQAPYVIVRANGDVTIQGVEGDRVQASTDSRWGLKIEQRSESEIGRVRAKVGERVLFDVHLDVKNPLKSTAPREVTEVQIGGSGTVQVPSHSTVKVYAGKGVELQDIQDSVTIYAGSDVRVRNVRTVVHVSAGGALDFECEEVEGDQAKFVAGRDLRCYVKNLTSAQVLVNDLGGYWEAVLGEGRIILQLKAGGDVTLVTAQEVKAKPPHFILGKIERPA